MASAVRGNPRALIAGATVALLLAVPAVPAIAAEPEASVSDLAWLAGSWVGRQGDTEMEEYWTTPAGGMLVGMHRDVRPGRPAFFEFLRIAEGEDGIAYLAMPAGRAPATAFRLLSISERKVVFENPAHDFPQRILYRLDDDGVLHARIEGTEGGEERGVDWTFRRRNAD